MSETDRLIQYVASCGHPTIGLRAPEIRMLSWFAVSVPYVAIVVLAASPRADILATLGDARFLVEQTAALATALIAAMAAFCATVPGLSTRRLLMPLVPLGLWVGALVQGCISTILEDGFTALKFVPDPVCFPAILVVSALPAVLMITMLKRGAPLLPKITVAYGALAATALGNFGLRLFHPQDASLMVLVWQFGTVVILTGLAGIFGRRLLRWRHVASA